MSSALASLPARCVTASRVARASGAPPTGGSNIPANSDRSGPSRSQAMSAIGSGCAAVASRSKSNRCFGRRHAVVSSTSRLVIGSSSRVSSDAGIVGSIQNVAVGTPGTCSARTSAPKCASAPGGPATMISSE